MIVIGVIDRTGSVLPLAESAAAGIEDEAKVIDLGPVSKLEADSPQADVLFVGPEEITADGVRRIKAWREANPASMSIAVVPKGGPRSDELKKMGFDKVALAPLTVGKAIQKAVERSKAQSAAAAEVEIRLLEEEGTPATLGATEEDAGDLTEALILTVASATGGCGKTFYATNMAAAVGPSGKRVLVIDLDLQFGEVAIGLRVRHPYSIYDGLYDSEQRPLPAEAFQEQLDDLVYHHELGFDVLTAPKDPVFADYIGASDAARVIQAAAPKYDVVIVDTPPSLNEVVLTALDMSSVVAVLATPDVPSLKNLGVFLDTLRRLKIPDSHLRLILNKIDRDIGLEFKEIQETFKNRFVGAIPHSRMVSRALNLGTVSVDIAPKSEVSRKLRDSIAAVLPFEVDFKPPKSQSSGRRLMRRFGLGAKGSTRVSEDSV